jgi:hypothetical protein
MRQASLFLLPVLFFSAGCSSDKYPANSRKLAEWAISCGGAVTLAEKNEELRDASLLPNKPFGIAAINFTDADLSPIDFKRFPEISKLDRLSLYGTKISDVEIDFLLGIDSLNELELSNTRITDKGLKKLRELKTLKKLFLHNTLVTQAGVDAFQKSLPGCKVYAGPAN